MNARVFVKNESIIIKINLKTALSSIIIPEIKEYEYRIIEDSKMISEFYVSNGRLDFSEEYVKFQLSTGCEFHAIVIDNTIVAGMLIHLGTTVINTPSFYALQDRPGDKVIFDESVIYSSHNIVRKEYRGKHLYTLLLYHILSCYNSVKESYVIITGIDNKKMLRSSFELGGKMIGYVFTSRVLSLFWFKKIKYLNEREVCWHSVNK